MPGTRRRRLLDLAETTTCDSKPATPQETARRVRALRERPEVGYRPTSNNVISGRTPKRSGRTETPMPRET